MTLELYFRLYTSRYWNAFRFESLSFNYSLVLQQFGSLTCRFLLLNSRPFSSNSDRTKLFIERKGFVDYVQVDISPRTSLLCACCGKNSPTRGFAYTLHFHCNVGAISLSSYKILKEKVAHPWLPSAMSQRNVRQTFACFVSVLNTKTVARRSMKGSLHDAQLETASDESQTQREIARPYVCGTVCDVTAHQSGRKAGSFERTPIMPRLAGSGCFLTRQALKGESVPCTLAAKDNKSVPM